MARCPKCKKNEISLEDKEMNRKAGDVEVCADCYFDELSDLVEKFPPRSPGRIRPGGTSGIGDDHED